MPTDISRLLSAIATTVVSRYRADEISKYDSYNYGLKSFLRRVFEHGGLRRQLAQANVPQKLAKSFGN